MAANDNIAGDDHHMCAEPEDGTKSSTSSRTSKAAAGNTGVGPPSSDEVTLIVEDLKAAGLDERLKSENLTIVAFVGGRSGFGSTEIYLTRLADKVKHKINEGT